MSVYPNFFMTLRST